MPKSYDLLEVVLTLDTCGRLIEIDIPDGVIVTVDRIAVIEKAIDTSVLYEGTHVIKNT